MPQAVILLLWRGGTADWGQTVCPALSDWHLGVYQAVCPTPRRDVYGDSHRWLPSRACVMCVT